MRLAAGFEASSRRCVRRSATRTGNASCCGCARVQRYCCPLLRKRKENKVSKFIPSPEFSIMQEQRIKALEASAYRVLNTLSHIGAQTKEPDTRDRAYATLGTYPKTPRCTRSHPHEEMTSIAKR